MCDFPDLPLALVMEEILGWEKPADQENENQEQESGQ